MRNRVDRIWKSNHTFITTEDWKLLADQWRSSLDDAYINPDDYEELYLEVRRKLDKVDRDNAEEFDAVMKDLVENDRIAYFAYMYRSTCELAKIFPLGYWIKNKDVNLLERVRYVRQMAKTKNRLSPTRDL